MSLLNKENVKADGNVPFQDNPRYQLLGYAPTRFTHDFINGAEPEGINPRTVLLEEDLLPPSSVANSAAAWEGLSKGGLFVIDGKEVIVEELFETGGASAASWKIVTLKDGVNFLGEKHDIDASDLDEVGPAPATPFTLYPGQWLRADNLAGPLGSAGTVGFVGRLSSRSIQ